MWTGWSGVGDGVDTPQTVMTTRAPAVLTNDDANMHSNKKQAKQPNN